MAINKKWVLCIHHSHRVPIPHLSSKGELETEGGAPDCSGVVYDLRTTIHH